MRSQIETVKLHNIGGSGDVKEAAPHKAESGEKLTGKARAKELGETFTYTLLGTAEDGTHMDS